MIDRITAIVDGIILLCLLIKATTLLFTGHIFVSVLVFLLAYWWFTSLLTYTKKC